MGQGQPMEIVFIGAGNLATQLSQAFQRVGHNVIQVFSRTQENASALGARLGCEWTTSLEGIRKDAHLYVISVSDSAFQQVAEKLHATLQSVPAKDCSQTGSNALFVHTAGSISVDLLPMERRGVFYPMQTFNKYNSVDFSQIPIFIESRTDLDCLQHLASQLSQKVYELDGSRRKLLHVAAVFACNFSNHMYDLSSRILQEYDIPFDVMLPLIDETVRKVHLMSPKEAQTGPAVRYDQNVMHCHMQMLRDEKMKRIYQLLSESIHDKL